MVKSLNFTNLVLLFVENGNNKLFYSMLDETLQLFLSPQDDEKLDGENLMMWRENMHWLLLLAGRQTFFLIKILFI